MIKKLRAKKILSILSVSLGIIISALFSNVQKVDAATYLRFTSNGISGSISSNFQGTADITNATAFLCTEITINFDENCSGNVSIYLYNEFGNNYDVLLENAYITAKNSSSLSLEWNNVSYIHLNIYVSSDQALDWMHDNGLGSGLHEYWTTNWESHFNWRSASFFNVVSGTDLNDVDSSLGHIETDIERTNNLLTQLINNGISVNGGATQVSVNSGTLWPLYTTSFILMLNKMGFSWNVTTQPQTAVATGLSGLTTQSAYNEFIVKPNSTLHVIWYSNTTGFYIVKNGSSQWDDTPSGYNKTIIDNISGVVLQYATIENGSSEQFCWWYWDNAGAYIIPVYWGYDPPDEVLNLINDETMVIQKMNEILQAIQDINITVENDTEINNYITNKDTTITNIKNDHTTVNNITNDFSLDFTDANDDITLDTDIIDGLVDTSTFWKQKLGETVTALDDFQYPVVLGFILLALLALIGA